MAAQIHPTLRSEDGRTKASATTNKAAATSAMTTIPTVIPLVPVTFAAT
jgi:hypothetical protein